MGIITRGNNARLVINDAAVAEFVKPGGAVWNLDAEVVKSAKDWSKGYALKHKRSGRLAGGVNHANPKTTGPLEIAGYVYSSARHTRYFMDDTSGLIYGKPFLVIPKRRGMAHTNPAYAGAGSQHLAEVGKRSEKQQARGKGVMRREYVHGYRAHPFLQDGLRASLAKHGLR